MSITTSGGAPHSKESSGCTSRNSIYAPGRSGEVQRCPRTSRSIGSSEVFSFVRASYVTACKSLERFAHKRRADARYLPSLRSTACQSAARKLYERYSSEIISSKKFQLVYRSLLFDIIYSEKEKSILPAMFTGYRYRTFLYLVKCSLN